MNERIVSRIATYREKIRLITNSQDEELKKNYRDRDQRLLLFLNREYCVYKFAIDEMTAILNS